MGRKQVFPIFEVNLLGRQDLKMMLVHLEEVVRDQPSTPVQFELASSHPHSVRRKYVLLNLEPPARLIVL